MKNVGALHGTNITFWKGRYGDGVALAGNKLYFIGLSVFVHMHYRPHIATLELIFFQILGKYNSI
jgi:hypothetical protein